MTPAEKKGLHEGQWVWFEGDKDQGRPAQWLQLKKDDRTTVPSFTPGIGVGPPHCWFHHLKEFDWSRGIHDEKPTEDNNISNTITLTQEQQAALNRGEPITIEPPKPEKWEPEGGPWWINGRHEVKYGPSEDPVRLAGRERKRQDIAKRDAKEGRLHDLLMAYRAQYAPDYVVPPSGEYAHKVHMRKNGRAVVYSVPNRALGAVYFPEWLAEQLRDDINAGRFDIGALRVPEDD